jgi:hypothetical protein
LLLKGRGFDRKGRKIAFRALNTGFLPCERVKSW